MRLAHADRPVEKAIAAGSVPPELRALWNRLEAAGVQVELFDRGAVERGEQQAPDRVLQLQMLRDFADYNGDPGVVVLLTGDGHGFLRWSGLSRRREAYAPARLASGDSVVGRLVQPSARGSG